MIVSRLRTICRLSKCVNNSKSIVPSRNGSHAPFYYRVNHHPAPKGVERLATGLMTFAWYWVFWHFYYDSGHFVGHFDYPNPSSWTNAELGIPEDDA